MPNSSISFLKNINIDAKNFSLDLINKGFVSNQKNQNQYLIQKVLMYIVDSHCHLYYEPFISNLKKTIDECRSKGVNRLLSISVNYETSLKNIKIVSEFEEIFCTIGLHPINVVNEKKNLNKILDLYKPNSKIIGIGEAGIDLYRSSENLKDQINCFHQQIEFCIENKLPLVIHSRDAEKETINV